jgi:hypothetical protein
MYSIGGEWLINSGLLRFKMVSASGTRVGVVPVKHSTSEDVEMVVLPVNAFIDEGKTGC